MQHSRANSPDKKTKEETDRMQSISTERAMFGISSASRNRRGQNTSNALPLWKKTALATALMLLAGARTSMAGSGAADIPSPAQSEQARKLCTVIIGIHPDDQHFDGCVASLAASLRSAQEEHAIIQARDECFGRRLRPGSSELSLCLLSASAVNPKSGPANPSSGDNASENTRDRSDPTNVVSIALGNMIDRERQACARTGFDPAFGAFSNCVADLQSVLAPRDDITPTS